MALRRYRIQLTFEDAISHTVGASLTFGRRYGARFIVDRWSVSGASLVLLQVGGYVSF